MLKTVHVNTLMVTRVFFVCLTIYIKLDELNVMDTVRKHPSVPFCKATFCTVLGYTVKCSFFFMFSCKFCCFKRTNNDFQTASKANRDFTGSFAKYLLFCIPPDFWILLFQIKDEKRLCSYETNEKTDVFCFDLVFMGTEPHVGLRQHNVEEDH